MLLTSVLQGASHIARTGFILDILLDIMNNKTYNFHV